MRRRWMIWALSHITTTVPTLRTQSFLCHGGGSKLLRHLGSMSGWLAPSLYPVTESSLARHGAFDTRSTASRLRLVIYRVRRSRRQSCLRTGLPAAPEWGKDPAQHYWLERAEPRLVDRIAPIAWDILISPHRESYFSLCNQERLLTRNNRNATHRQRMSAIRRDPHQKTFTFLDIGHSLMNSGSVPSERTMVSHSSIGRFSPPALHGLNAISFKWKTDRFPAQSR